jgi:hypothetical protein
VGLEAVSLAVDARRGFLVRRFHDEYPNAEPGEAVVTLVTITSSP